MTKAMGYFLSAWTRYRCVKPPTDELELKFAQHLCHTLWIDALANSQILLSKFAPSTFIDYASCPTKISAWVRSVVSVIYSCCSNGSSRKWLDFLFILAFFIDVHCPLHQTKDARAICLDRISCVFYSNCLQALKRWSICLWELNRKIQWR